MKHSILAAAAAFILTQTASVPAQDVPHCSVLSLKSDRVSEMKLASLEEGGGIDGSALLTPRRGGQFAPVIVDRPTGQPPILIAGRCGSSDYYCDEKGATYCCGNSTDGFYCAKDVNSC